MISRSVPLVLTRSQVREVDRRAVQEYGMSGLVLMENAGRGTADVVCQALIDGDAARRSVVVVCGRGNNGGDGFVIARHLDLRGIAVKVLLVADPAALAGDAAANFAILQHAGVEIATFSAPLDIARFDEALAGAALLIDALLGTGATGQPKPPLGDAIDRMNASGAPIVAVDVPSGLDCDTGAAARSTIRAAHTCTFVAAKPGFFDPSAGDYVGQLHVLDIGAPRRLIEDLGASP